PVAGQVGSATANGGKSEAIRRAQAPFFAGFGLLAFSVFRFFLVESFRSAPYWAEFWEETTELAVVLALCLFLWVMRRQLRLLVDG
ncbi:MAG: hypothetical protein V2A73_10890, partial [Pseudomonadota bacterium]